MVACRAWPQLGLLVAANRDEQLARPADPPRLWWSRPVPLWAPVDLQAGGTWLGLNAAGVFAGITNRMGTVAPVAGRRSRGMLVLDALEERSARAAAARIMSAPARRHNRFHLLIADLHEVHLVWSDGDTLRHEPRQQGIHVLTERAFGAGPDHRGAWLAGVFASTWHQAPPEDGELMDIMGRHAQDPFDGTCVHASGLQYGTRSSTLIRLAPGGELLTARHAPGPPCATPYRDLTDQAASLFSGRPAPSGRMP